MATYNNIKKIKIGDNVYNLYDSGNSGGTVTLVTVSNATNGGLTITGSPISTSGTISIGHSNVLTSAQTTEGVYPIKIDKNGHISAYGTKVTIVNTRGTAASGGTTLSVVNTGDMYTWNNKQDKLTNPVTGTGTSGYLVKWNGTTSVTNGPQLGSSTTTFLNNKGEWATPVDTKVALTSKTDNNVYPLLFGPTSITSGSAYGANYNTNIVINPSEGIIKATKGIFNELIATNATITNLTATNAKVVGILDVTQGELHTSKWTNANISNIGGSFYISPTVNTEYASGNSSYMTVSVTGSENNRTIAVSGGNFATDAARYYDNTGSHVADWAVNSKVMITGNVRNGNTGVDYPLGTCVGRISGSKMTAGGFTITGVSSPALESIITELGVTSFKSKNITISMYEIGDSSDANILKPVGIMLTSYGTNNSTYIDIYGGVNTKNSSTGLIDPNVRIGYLGDGTTNYGLEKLGGSAEYPKGWGVYTDNGYFKGTVIADSGVIGGCTINNGYLEIPTARIQNFSTNAISAVTGAFSMLSSGVITTNSSRTTYDSILAGLTLDMNGIGAGNGTSNTFKVVQSTGILTATGAILKEIVLQDNQDRTLATVSSEGLILYDGSGTDEENRVASFGSSSQIGRNIDTHLSITNEEIDLTNSEDNSVFNINAIAGSLNVPMTAQVGRQNFIISNTTAKTRTISIKKNNINKVVLAPVKITFMNIIGTGPTFTTSNCTVVRLSTNPLTINIYPNVTNLTTTGSTYEYYIQSPSSGGGGGPTTVPYMKITILTKFTSTTQIDVTITVQALLTPSGFIPIIVDNGSYVKYSDTIAAPAYTIGNRTKDDTITNGGYSVAMGFGLKASEDYQVAIGKYNEGLANTIFEIGNGTGDSTRENIFEIQNNGRVVLHNNISLRGKLADNSDTVQLAYLSSSNNAVFGPESTTTYNTYLRGNTITISTNTLNLPSGNSTSFSSDIDTYSTSTSNNYFTPNTTNITFSRIDVRKWGKLVSFRLQYKFKTAQSVTAKGDLDANVELGTMKTGYVPAHYVVGSSGAGAHGAITNSGSVSATSFEGSGSTRTVSTSTTNSLYFIYIIS